MPRQDGREHIPLLSRGNIKPERNQLVIKGDRENYEQETPEEKARDAQLFAENMNRGDSLLFQDTLILIAQLFQLFGVAASLGLRWQWPYKWVKATYYVLLLNFDVWDFLKVHSGEYKDRQNYDVPTDDMPCSYWVILLAWGVVVFVGFLVYVIIYAVIQYKHDVLMLSQIAKLQWVYIVILQFLAIPFGVATGRVFHCNDKNKVDVDNDLRCFSDHHWAYIVPVCGLWILYYILFTVWLIYKTRVEMLSMPSERHEAYLQLKEIEFAHGLDVDWMVGHFHVFSSFRKWGSYYRAATHIFIGLVVMFYAALHGKEQIQAIILTCIIFLVFLTCCFLRPYRISIFNFALCWSLFCIFAAFLTGAFISSFDNTTVNSVYLTEKYMTYILVVVGVAFVVVGLVIPLLYIIIRHNQRQCCPCCLPKEQVQGINGPEIRRRWEPLWPALSSSTLYKLSPETQKFIKAILKGRVISEKILLMPPLFAPAHELARHIHVINAYCREAEYLQDPMQSTLWDLLDELIEAHERVAPKSLFAESVKPSIKKTASEFLEMMPAFTRRLAQREYDFLLMRPVKRRMLLKMYCMGLFLNNRREKAIKQRLTMPHLEKVWKKSGPVREEDEFQDDGYYEDMYPTIGEEPTTYRPDTAIALDLLSLGDPESRDDDAVLNEAEKWTQSHPMMDLDRSMSPLPSALLTTPHQYTNLVFADDFSDTSSMATGRDRDSASISSFRGESQHYSHTAKIQGSQISVRSIQSQQKLQMGSQVSVRSTTFKKPMGSHVSLRSNKQYEAENAEKENKEAAEPSDDVIDLIDLNESENKFATSHLTESDTDAVISLQPSHEGLDETRPASSASRRGGMNRPPSAQSKQSKQLPPDVAGSRVSLQSNQSQVPIAGHEEDPADMPTEFAV